MMWDILNLKKMLDYDKLSEINGINKGVTPFCLGGIINPEM